MKSNNVMIRKMGTFDVLQRTSDSMFNASSLVEQWNNVKGNAKKSVADFMRLKETKEFIDELKKDFVNSQCADNDIDRLISHTIKGKHTKNGSTKDIVYFNPYLFIKFAMYLNKRFELQVIKFVYDELIKNRHEAGDNYNVLTRSIASMPDSDYRQVAIAMQWIVYNKTGKNLRNSATQEQLKEMAELEKKVAFMIDMGFVKNNIQLINALRKIYNDKYSKF